MLKKSVLVVALLLATTNVWAVKTWDVSATKHNLGSTAPPLASGYASSNEDEVCVYCHTPHGGTLDAPLWNRDLSYLAGGTGFTHYTSTTLSGYMSGAGMDTRTVNTESLLCLACHDGAVAMGTVINVNNRTVGIPDNVAMFDPSFGFSPSPVVGGAGGKNLSDDHPISFSYYDASLPINNDKLRVETGSTPATDPSAKGIRFFGAGAVAGGQRVECSSCHDPHVNGNVDAQYLPFLVMSNTGSALCLACHIK